MKPADRLKIARREAGFSSARAAAIAMGISVGTYSGHENGNRGLSQDFAERYARRFGVRASWLMFGDGAPRRGEASYARIGGASGGASEGSSDVEAQGDAVARPYVREADGAVPEIDAKPTSSVGLAGMRQFYSLPSRSGTTTGHRVVGEWVFPCSYVEHELAAHASALIVVAMLGDAMQPTLAASDRLLVDTSQNSLAVDGLFVFDDWDGNPQVRRLARVIASDPPRVRLLADNPLHPDSEVDLANLRIIGRVVGRVTRL